jgi:surface protein
MSLIGYKFTKTEDLRRAIEAYNNPDSHIETISTYGKIEDWDVSQITDMNHLFYGIRGFNEPIGKWDVSNVTNMSSMFKNTQSFNQNISNWDVSKVTNMSSMFHAAYEFNQNISNWNVSNVTDMSNMFRLAEEFNQDISNWNVSNVTNMNSMFKSDDINNDDGQQEYYKFNQPIGNWNVSNVTNILMMFENSNNFNNSLSNWKDKLSKEVKNTINYRSVNNNKYPIEFSILFKPEIPEAARSQLDDEIPEAEIKNLWKEGEESTLFPLLTELSSEIPEKIGKLTTFNIIQQIEEPITEIISELIESNYDPIVLLKPDFKNFDVIGTNWPGNKVFVECTDSTPDEWQDRTSYREYIKQPQQTYLKIPFKGFPIMVATPDWWGTCDKSIINTIFFKLVERPQKIFKFMDYLLTKVTETRNGSTVTLTNEFFPVGSEVGADHCNQKQNETQISYDLVPVSKSEIDAMESTIGGRGVKKPQKRVTRRRKYSKKKSSKRTVKQSAKHKKQPKMTKKRKPHYNRYTKNKKTKKIKNKR